MSGLIPLLGLLTLGALLGGIYLAGRRSGAGAAESTAAEEEVDAAERVAKAAGSAPATRADLVDRLRSGGGL